MKATSFATKAIRSGAPLAFALLSSRAASAAPEPSPPASATPTASATPAGTAPVGAASSGAASPGAPPAGTASAGAAPVGAPPVGASPAQAPAKPPGEPEWYGHHIVAADLLAIGVGLGAYAASSPWREDAREPPGAPAFVATSVYGLGAVLPPAVHFAHRQVGMGFASLGIRVVVPPISGLAGLLGACTANGGDSPCARHGVIAGMLVGEAVAAGLDAAVLAHDRPSTRGSPSVNWYGWQTLTADAATLGLAAYVMTRPRPAPEPGEERRERHALDVGIGWYAFSWLGAPVVHFAHGRVGVGFADLGIRLVAPGVAVLPGIVGACAGLGGRRGCSETGAFAGLLGGTALAAAFDALVLAREKQPAPDDDASSFFWAPTLQPTPGGATGGVFGAF